MANNIPEVYVLQATKKNLELAKAFQDDMGAHFFDHTMYDVKDALTSILALCDMEDMKQVPQVKKCIQRVTDLLNDVKFYSSSSLFNVNHVVINVINLMNDKYKSRININHNLSFIKAHVKSDKSHLEQVLLYSLIEAVESCADGLNLQVELAQKETDAVITLKLENFYYSSVVLKEIMAFHKASVFKMQITGQGGGVEIVIRLPLSFNSKEEDIISSESAANVKLGELKAVEKDGVIVVGRDEEEPVKKTRERALVNGAQERT